MSVSRNRPEHKVKKKENNIKKAKFKQQMNELKKEANMPVSYTYHKDADHVKVPMRAWQVLNTMVKQLEPFAVLFSTMEQMGQEHINDGTLIPVFKEDVEVEMKDGAPLIIQGQIQHKLKEGFWSKHKVLKSATPVSGLVGPDGNTAIEETLAESEAETL